MIVLLKNDAYSILDLELARVRDGEANARMNALTSLANPTLDWISIAARPLRFCQPRCLRGGFSCPFQGGHGGKRATSHRVPGADHQGMARARGLRPRPSLSSAPLPAHEKAASGVRGGLISCCSA